MNIMFNTVVAYGLDDVVSYEFDNKRDMQLFNDELVMNYSKDDILSVMNLAVFMDTQKTKKLKLNDVWEELPKKYQDDKFGELEFLALAYKTSLNS